MKKNKPYMWSIIFMPEHFHLTVSQLKHIISIMKPTPVLLILTDGSTKLPNLENSVSLEFLHLQGPSPTNFNLQISLTPSHSLHSYSHCSDRSWMCKRVPTLWLWLCPCPSLCRAARVARSLQLHPCRPSDLRSVLPDHACKSNRSPSAASILFFPSHRLCLKPSYSFA